MFQLYDLPTSKITDKTIDVIHKFIREAKTDPTFVNLARDMVVRECLPRDGLCELKTVYRKLKSILHYFYDPNQVEYVQSPWETYRTLAGDCDDFVTLISAIMGSLGYQYRIIVMKADRTKDEWSHVFSEIKLPNKGWVAVDLTVSEATVSWSPLSMGKYEYKIYPEPVY
jgi:transglutaminase-like putative cysteine protease